MTPFYTYNLAESNKISSTGCSNSFNHVTLERKEVGVATSVATETN